MHTDLPKVYEAFFLQIAYDVTHSQLAYLQVWSKSATQRITFKCDGMSVVRDATTTGSEAQRHRRAVRLIGDGDVVFENPTSEAHDTYSVLVDECQHRKPGSNARTTIEIRGRAPMLPLRDIALADAGGKRQEFGLVIGHVCFE